jgi:hypothetical protein
VRLIPKESAALSWDLYPRAIRSAFILAPTFLNLVSSICTFFLPSIKPKMPYFSLQVNRLCAVCLRAVCLQTEYWQECCILNSVQVTNDSLGDRYSKTPAAGRFKTELRNSPKCKSYRMPPSRRRGHKLKSVYGKRVDCNDWAEHSSAVLHLRNEEKEIARAKHIIGP